MADFIPVKGRYADFFKALFSVDHLDQNIGVEIEIIGVKLKWHRF
jgi:hypothetical protein